MIKKNELNRKKRINVTIALILIWIFCIMIYFIFVNFKKLPIKYSILILLTETFLCFIMWIFFMVKIDWLKDINTGREIMHLNLSNILSALRFALVPLLI